MLGVRVLSVLATAVALIAVACGGGSGGDSPDRAAELPPAAGACLAGAVDCQDVGPLPTNDGTLVPSETDGGAYAGGPSAPLVVGGGLSVEDLLSSDVDGVVAVGAFYLSDGTGAWLCDLLAESFPPQCGGERVAIEGADAVIDADDLDAAGGVTWSAQPVIVLGTVEGGVFVATPLAQ